MMMPREAVLEGNRLVFKRFRGLARIKYECDMGTASYGAALARVGKVYDLSGVFPGGVERVCRLGGQGGVADLRRT